MRTPALIAFMVLSHAALVAQTAEDLFARANESYRAGRYDEAAQGYEQILAQRSASTAVYFNLGNSYYRLGKLAPAILAFERAGRLDPADADVRHNLRLLNLKTIDRIEPVPDLFLIQWMRSGAAVLAPRTTQWLFLVSWFLLFAALAVLYVVPSAVVMRVARATALLCIVGVALSGALLGLQRINSESRDQAVVIAPTVTAKSSPDAGSVDAFVIHEGLKVRMSDAVGAWVKVTLPDGKVGWILSAQCERI